MQEKANKFTLIKQRIMYFVENQNIKKIDFFDKIGMTSANFRGSALKTPLNSNTIENIVSLYPQLNLQWLITGKGQMIKDNYENFSPKVNILNEPSEDYNNLEFIKNDYIKTLKKENNELTNDKYFLQKIIEQKLNLK